MNPKKISNFLAGVLLGTTSFAALATACSIHDHGCRFHGAPGQNQTGVPAVQGGSLNFTTTWTPNSQGETPDLDTHVLLQEDAGPYIVSGRRDPIGVNTPYRPWPYGSPEFERNVYYVQPDITYNNGQARARHSEDIGTTNPTGHCDLTGSGTCEEIRITGNLPAGEVRQFTYRPIATPGSPANPPGEGSTYLTQIWSTPGYVIDKVTVGGVEAFPDHRGIYSTGEGRALLRDTEYSPEVVVTGHAVNAHATGVQLAHTGNSTNKKMVNIEKNALAKQLRTINYIDIESKDIGMLKSLYKHYYRNNLARQPDFDNKEQFFKYAEQNGMKIGKFDPSQAIFHQYSHADIEKWGTDQGYEYVFDSSGKRIRSADDRDSYNYAPPTIENGRAYYSKFDPNYYKHASEDVTPYIIFGNSSDDPTTFTQRATTPIQNLINDQSSNTYDSAGNEILNIITDDPLQDTVKKYLNNRLYRAVKYYSTGVNLRNSILYARRTGEYLAKKDYKAIPNALHMPGEFFGPVDTLADMLDTGFEIYEKNSQADSILGATSGSVESIDDFLADGYYSYAMSEYNKSIEGVVNRINKEGLNMHTLLEASSVITIGSAKATIQMLFGATLRFYNTIPSSFLKAPIKRELKVLEMRARESKKVLKKKWGKSKKRAIKAVGMTKSMVSRTLKETGQMVKATREKVWNVAKGSFNGTAKWFSSLKLW